MKKYYSVFLLLFSVFQASCQQLFVASDHTATDLFTAGIEGPAFNKEGNCMSLILEKRVPLGLVNDPDFPLNV